MALSTTVAPIPAYPSLYIPKSGSSTPAGKWDPIRFKKVPYKLSEIAQGKIGYYYADYEKPIPPENDEEGNFYDNEFLLAIRKVLNSIHDFFQLTRALMRISDLANGLTEHNIYPSPYADLINQIIDKLFNKNLDLGLDKEGAATATSFTILSLVYNFYLVSVIRQCRRGVVEEDPSLGFWESLLEVWRGWKHEYVEAIKAAFDETYEFVETSNKTYVTKSYNNGHWRKNQPKRIIHSMLEAATWGPGNSISAILAFERTLGAPEFANLLGALSWGIFGLSIIIDTFNTVIEQTVAINALKRKLKQSSLNEIRTINRDINRIWWNRVSTLWFGTTALSASLCALSSETLQQIGTHSLELTTNLAFSAGMLLSGACIIFIAIRFATEYLSLSDEYDALEEKIIGLRTNAKQYKEDYFLRKATFELNTIFSYVDPNMDQKNNVALQQALNSLAFMADDVTKAELKNRILEHFNVMSSAISSDNHKKIDSIIDQISEITTEQKHIDNVIVSLTLQQNLIFYKQFKCVCFWMCVTAVVGVGIATTPVGALCAFAAFFVLRVLYNRLFDPLVEEKIEKETRKTFDKPIAAPVPSVASTTAAAAASVSAPPPLWKSFVPCLGGGTGSR